jgi:S-disulfanyl-L-cysteine oxidoreductase SoxD
MANDQPARARRQRLFMAALALGLFVGTVGLPTSVQARDKQPPTGAEPSKLTIYDGVFTAEQVETGQRLYVDECRACHGPAAGGSTCPNLIGTVINEKYAGVPLSAYYTVMQTLMPKGRPGSLQDQEYADIMAFLLKMHGAKPGEHRLTPDEALLDNIIMGPKPPKDGAGASKGASNGEEKIR